MPDQISVSEFVAETHEDYKAPTASSFTTRTAQCRNTVAAIEEVSGSLGGAGREARAAGIALRPGDPLGFRAWCPIPSARHLRLHPGKVSGPPRAGRGRASSARHRSPLFPERWLWGEAAWPPWAFFGNPSACSHFPRRVSDPLLPSSERSTSAAESMAAASRGPLRALRPRSDGSPCADLSNLFQKWPGGGSCAF